jgi:TNF receptor-associated protein 1
MTTTQESPQQHVFQAEVRQLLDIVIHSLYTDKEIFVRELVSNASDALEKMRLKELTEGDVQEKGKALEITITTDEEAKTLTIADSGIGMTEEELVQNLGTIAHSGTKAFLQAMKEKGETGPDVIGQFGVGFYSAFMAADKVEVFTKSWQPGATGFKWESDGQGGYTIEAADDVVRGSKMVLHLKDEAFAKADKIKELLKKYSNFVSFPILLNGERVNTVEALWLKSKSSVTPEEYTEFYRFTAHAWDEPFFTMHFSADAPLSINALLFVPGENNERFGMGQMEPGVALYCKKVLIDPKPTGLLPEWLRFLRGVIDSADLPLNISRESMQDSALVRKLNQLITKRFLKFLEKQASDEPEKYREFHEKFSRFLKEGIATSHEHQEALAGLLRFESSMTEPGKVSSFAEYIARAKDGQEEIYYLTGPSREVLETGPYLEAFKARGLEVAYFTDVVDSYVFQSLAEVSGKKLVPADRAEIEMEDLANDQEKLSETDSSSLTAWLGEKLSSRVSGVTVGKRLVGSPAIALTEKDAPTPQIRAMMKAMGQEMPEPKPTLEINASHGLVKKLSALKDSDPDLAEAIGTQLADQALLAAGLVENPQAVAARMNSLLERVLK